jgi:glycine cleavage system transcriptional repressor
MQSEQLLAISALGQDRAGIVDQLSKGLFEAGCNIVDSRMTVLGGEFALMLLASGAQDDLARAEAQLPELSQRLGLTVIMRRTGRRGSRSGAIPYHVTAVAIDHPGIVYQLASFFSSRDINIENLNTDSYAAPHTGTPMFAVDMTINLSQGVKPAALREEFLDFCDTLNIDASLDSYKGSS